jgi:hypothetical protein
LSESLTGGTPIFEVPGDGEGVEKVPLQYFEWSEEKFGFPSMKYDEIFTGLVDKLKEKLPLSWVDQLSNVSSSSSYDLSWVVEFDFEGSHFGPWSFDLGKKIQEVALTDFARMLRLFFLAFICIVFVLQVLGLFFAAS